MPSEYKPPPEYNPTPNKNVLNNGYKPSAYIRDFTANNIFFRGPKHDIKVLASASRDDSLGILMQAKVSHSLKTYKDKDHLKNLLL